jgi:hypothetical protein
VALDDESAHPAGSSQLGEIENIDHAPGVVWIAVRVNVYGTGERYGRRWLRSTD